MPIPCPHGEYRCKKCQTYPFSWVCETCRETIPAGTKHDETHAAEAEARRLAGAE